MGDLIRLNWQAFNLAAGIKVSLGLVVIMVLTHLTGEPWLASALAAMFAWLANTPGPLVNRIGGMLAFTAGAIAYTLLTAKIGLELWPNVIAIAVVGFLGTLALTRGVRAFMVGWSLICWAIYGPFLVATTGVGNCLLAILAGSGIVILLNVIGELIPGKEIPAPETAEVTEESVSSPGFDYILAYAITVAMVLSLTTYYGWVELKTDPTLMVGGAFFVIGFDAIKTWAAGIGRVIGLAGSIRLDNPRAFLR